MNVGIGAGEEVERLGHPFASSRRGRTAEDAQHGRAKSFKRRHSNRRG